MIAHSRWLAIALLCIWFAWAAAIQTQMATSPRFSSAAPDLVVVLLVSLAGAVRRKEILLIAILAALARKGFSIDPASALLAGSLALGGLAWTLRAFVDIQSPPWRALLAAVGAVGLAVWLELVRIVRGAGALETPQLEGLPMLALTSALAALALGGLFGHLPGTTPLRSVD